MKASGWGWVPLSCVVLVLATACGGSDDSGPPNSGYGKSQPLPTTVSCEALCDRQADCFEHLCNEDTASTRYTGFGELIAGQCKLICTEALLTSRVTANSWACLFGSSCRAAFADDACHAQATYQCL
jgi:hypothetical protein